MVKGVLPPCQQVVARDGDAGGSLKQGPRTHLAHAEGRLVYNGADRDGQNGNPGSDQEHSFLIGLGTRVRVLDTVYVSAEYVPRVSGFAKGDDHLSVAFEKRAGGHLFQVNLSKGFGSSPA